MPVARGAIDCDTVIHEMLTSFIDIIHAVGEVSEMTAICWQRIITVPVIGQLHRALFLTGGRHEHKRETPAFVFETACLFQSEKFVKGDGFVQVFDPHHRVQIC